MADDSVAGLNPGPQQQAQRQQQAWTQDQIKQAHDLAAALQSESLNSHPIYSPWAGAARLADALAGNIVQGRQAQAQRDIYQQQSEDNPALSLGTYGRSPPSALPGTTPEVTGQYGADRNEAKAIANNESGGNYNEIGPRVAATGSHPAGYALGKYQVMNYDLPNRPAAAGPPSMSEQEFLANPDAQEKQFAHEWGNLRQSHSFADAASMWHSGVPLDQAIAQHRSDGYMTTGDYVSKAVNYLKNLNPVSPAGAAELTPQALAAAGAARAPTFASRFGSQPQTFDQTGNPLPAGAPPSTFDQRFGGPSVPVPIPRPAGMGSGGPAPQAAVGASLPPAAAAPPRPQVSVTPSGMEAPAQTGPNYQPGSFIPGAVDPRQVPALKAQISRMIANPATHDQGMAWLDRITDKPVQLQTGHTAFGNEMTGYHVTGLPGLPQVGPHIKTPIGEVPTVLPGSQPLTLPTGILPQGALPNGTPRTEEQRRAAHAGNPLQDLWKLLHPQQQ
jgi:hypothetical protein